MTFSIRLAVLPTDGAHLTAALDDEGASCAVASDAWIGRWLLHKPVADSLKPFSGRDRKSRKSWLARGPLCLSSALRAPGATVTASAAQVFADGFMQQPRRDAVVRAGGNLAPAFEHRRACPALPHPSV